MKNILIIILTIGTLSTFGQSKMQDVIYLKNGSIIKGAILQNNEKVKIKTADYSILVFKSSEIDSIGKDFKEKKKIEYATSGFYNSSTLGFLVGENYAGIVTDISIKTINGYQINENHAVGIGLALESFSNSTFHSSLDYRYYLLKKPTTPYANGYLGYSFATDAENNGQRGGTILKNEGGYNYGLSIGLRHYFSDHNAIDISLGYAFQEATSVYIFERWDAVSNRLVETESPTKTLNEYNRIALRIGFLFN